mgnify:FL=1|tara:strand:- start:341 stop:727 length:387 start_codon:yes stop_codon:yes gene_type:complete
MSILSNNENYAWFIGEGRLGILEKKTLSVVADPTWQSTQSGGKTIRLFYTARPIKLTDNLDDSPEIPDQFHEALVYKVIADLYKIPGDTFNLQLAQYYDQMFDSQVREGKKFASRNKVGGGYIKPVSY